uniref:C-type lectin domain-containing protein n=1 Tax=Moschus moschiferus TaxID=68415 RepID=A0A8C6CTH8_MOSMO
MRCVRPWIHWEDSKRRWESCGSSYARPTPRPQERCCHPPCLWDPWHPPLHSPRYPTQHPPWCPRQQHPLQHPPRCPAPQQLPQKPPQWPPQLPPSASPPPQALCATRAPRHGSISKRSATTSGREPRNGSRPGTPVKICTGGWLASTAQRSRWAWVLQGKWQIPTPISCGVRAGEPRHGSPALQPYPPPQDFLAKRANWRGSWIGLRDLDIEGEFIWMDNQPLDYSNWQPGEPNDAGQGENCVMMLGSGKWNDAFCGSELHGWVCDRLATC